MYRSVVDGLCPRCRGKRPGTTKGCARPCVRTQEGSSYTRRLVTIRSSAGRKGWDRGVGRPRPAEVPRNQRQPSTKVKTLTTLLTRCLLLFLICTLVSPAIARNAAGFSGCRRGRCRPVVQEPAPKTCVAGYTIVAPRQPVLPYVTLQEMNRAKMIASPVVQSRSLRTAPSRESYPSQTP